MNDRLQEVFERQLRLAQNFIPIGNLQNGTLPSEERQKYIQSYFQLLIEESVEMLREVPARKFWRPSVNSKPMDEDAWKEEMMDILHIVVALCLIGGMGADEVFARYVQKNEKNLERVRNNS